MTEAARKRRRALCLLGVSLVAPSVVAGPAPRAAHFEEFDTAGAPASPGTWTFRAQLYPNQATWNDVVPGDGYAHLIIDSDPANDISQLFQSIHVEAFGPGNRIETRYNSAVVVGVGSFIFTYREDAAGIDEIDIEIAADDLDAPPAGHDIDPPDGFSDARFNSWANAPNPGDHTSHRQAVRDANGDPVSHRDGRFHVYTIEWLSDRIDFYVDGVWQDSITDRVPDSPSDVIVGYRDMSWTGDLNNPGFPGTIEMLVDWIEIEPIDENTPHALADAYQTTMDVQLSVAAPSGVLANDDGSNLVVHLGGDPEHGTLALDTDGSLVYTPDAGFTGIDSFAYRVVDGTANGESNAATVTIEVLPAGGNLSPVAVASADPTTGSAPLTVAFSSAGSHDPDGTITDTDWDFGDGYTSTDPNPSHEYTADGLYTASLTVTDDGGATDADFVTVTVGAPNLVQNPGFETGSPVPWNNWSGSTVVTDNVRSGFYAGRTCTGAGECGFEQTINVLPDTAYELRAWAKLADAADTVSIGVKSHGGSNQFDFVTSTTAYEEGVVTFTTGPANTTAVIYCYKWPGGAGHVYCDDFSVACPGGGGAVPGEIGDLVVNLESPGSSTAVLGWSTDPVATAYNVYRATQPDLSDLGCFLGGVTGTSTPDDGTVPPPGGLFLYLVSGHTCAGESTLGSARANPAPCF